MWWFVAVAVVAISTWFFAVRSRDLKAFFAHEHFREIAAGLRLMQSNIRAAPLDADAPMRDDFTTTRHATVSWSIRRDGDGFVHHMAFSSPQVAWAANGFAFCYVFERLGLAWERADVFSTGSPVTHAMIALSAAEHHAVMSRPIDDPPGKEYLEFRRRLGAAMGPHLMGPRRVTIPAPERN